MLIKSERERWWHRGLPRLAGGWLLAYRMIWCLLALLAIAAVIQSYSDQRRYINTIREFYDTGLTPFLTNPGDQPMVRPYSSQAAGQVTDWEKLISVDGKDAHFGPDMQVPGLAGVEGSTANIVLERQDGTRHSLSLRRSETYLQEGYKGTGLTLERRRWITYGFMELTSIILLATGAILFLRCPRDPVAALLAVGSVAVVAADGSWLPATFGAPAILLISSLPSLAIMVGIVFFPDGRLTSRTSRFAFLVAMAVMTLEGVNSVVGFIPAAIERWIDVGLFLCIGLAIVLRFRTTPPGIGRQQMKFAILGFGLFMAFEALSVVCMAASEIFDGKGMGVWILLASAFVTVLGFAAFSAGLVISLTRYRLYDAEIAISRSIAYGALTIALLAIFAGSEKIIEVMGEEYLGHSYGAMAAGLAAAVAAVLINPLHHRISHWVEHRFQGALVHLRHALPDMLGDLRETASPQELADTVLAHVEQGVRAQHGAVMVNGAILGARDLDMATAQSWADGTDMEVQSCETLQWTRSDAIFPMRVPLTVRRSGTTGWLLLGPRPDGSNYGRDEQTTLQHVADPIARALSITMVRQNQNAARDEEMAEVRSAIAQMTETIVHLRRIISASHEPIRTQE